MRWEDHETCAGRLALRCATECPGTTRSGPSPLTPAHALGVDDRYGSLDIGKVADVVVWTGDPLDFASHAEHVFIRGVEVPHTSRQTELLERLPHPAAEVLASGVSSAVTGLSLILQWPRWRAAGCR